MWFAIGALKESRSCYILLQSWRSRICSLLPETVLPETDCAEAPWNVGWGGSFLRKRGPSFPAYHQRGDSNLSGPLLVFQRDLVCHFPANTGTVLSSLNLALVINVSTCRGVWVWDIDFIDASVGCSSSLVS